MQNTDSDGTAAIQEAQHLSEKVLRTRYDRERINREHKEEQNEQKIGFRMEMAVNYVRDHPGASQIEISKAIGAKGIATYGRNSLLKAIDAGLIKVIKDGKYYRHYIA